MRYDKIEDALSIAIAIREQRQQQQQEAPSASSIHTALVERLEGKLLASEMGLSELRKLVDAAWKGETVSYQGGDSYPLQKLEAVILTKEDECCKARKIVAEVRNKPGRTSRNPDLMHQSSSKSKKKRIAATCA
jgi:hypothetical protein